MARNTQLILLEEANLWRVADPAAGAGGFEALTDALCEKAWALFQEIEREGGIVESLARGSLQGRIATVRAAREKAVATRKEPITGTSEFPNIREAAVSVLLPAPDPTEPLSDGRAPGLGEPGISDSPSPGSGSPVASFSSLVEAASKGATLRSLATTAPGAGPVAIAPLPSSRAAEPFERLRDGRTTISARTGERPTVFLATLGPIAAFTARAHFRPELLRSRAASRRSSATGMRIWTR